MKSAGSVDLSSTGVIYPAREAALNLLSPVPVAPSSVPGCAGTHSPSPRIQRFLHFSVVHMGSFRACSRGKDPPQVTELILAPEPHTEPPATTSGVYQLNSPCGKHRAPLACSHSQIQMDFALATGKSWQKRIQVFSPCSSWAWSERRGLATGKAGAQRELKAHRSSLAGEGLGSSTCAGPCLNPERFRSWLAMR